MVFLLKVGGFFLRMGFFYLFVGWLLLLGFLFGQLVFFNS